MLVNRPQCTLAYYQKSENTFTCYSWLRWEALQPLQQTSIIFSFKLWSLSTLAVEIKHDSPDGACLWYGASPFFFFLRLTILPCRDWKTAAWNVKRSSFPTTWSAEMIATMEFNKDTDRSMVLRTTEYGTSKETLEFGCGICKQFFKFYSIEFSTVL